MTDLIKRVVIENVSPAVDKGRFPARRAINETVTISADIFVDGHDHLAARLLYRRAGDSRWRHLPMQLLVNDLWQASFIPHETGIYEYTVTAWIDRFDTWRSQVSKKRADGQNVSVELMEGARMAKEAAERAKKEDADQLNRLAEQLMSPEAAKNPEVFLTDTVFAGFMARYPDTDSQVE